MWIVPSVGGTPLKVADSPGQDTSIFGARWSPDSQRIVFGVQTFGEDEHDPTLFDDWFGQHRRVGVGKSDGHARGAGSYPVWFPDGRRILATYSSTPTPAPGATELAVINADAGGGYEVITDEPDVPLATGFYPVAFASDARQVVVGARPVLDPDPVNPSYGSSGLWRVDVASGDVTLLLGANTDNELRVMDGSFDGSSSCIGRKRVRRRRCGWRTPMVGTGPRCSRRRAWGCGMPGSILMPRWCC